MPQLCTMGQKKNQPPKIPPPPRTFPLAPVDKPLTQSRLRSGTTAGKGARNKDGPIPGEARLILPCQLSVAAIPALSASASQTAGPPKTGRHIHYSFCLEWLPLIIKVLLRLLITLSQKPSLLPWRWLITGLFHLICSSRLWYVAFNQVIIYYNTVKPEIGR